MLGGASSPSEPGHTGKMCSRRSQQGLGMIKMPV